MSRIRGIIYRTALSYTLITLAVNTIAVLADKGDKSLTMSNLLIFLGLSFFIGISFLVFDIKKIPKTGQRLIHIFFNYFAAILFIVKFTQKSEIATYTQTLIVIFFLTIVYTAVYALCCLAAYLIKRFADKAKKYLISEK